MKIVHALTWLQVLNKFNAFHINKRIFKKFHLCELRCYVRKPIFYTFLKTNHNLLFYKLLYQISSTNLIAQIVNQLQVKA